jgi:ATP-binding cassette subfamily B protein
VTSRQPRQEVAGGWRRQAKTARTAVALVWSVSPVLVVGIGVVSVAAGLIPPATAWLQRDVLDALVPEGKTIHLGLHGHDLLILVAALGLAGVAAAVTPQVQQYIQANLRRAVKAVVYDRVYQAVGSWPGIARFESPVYADNLQLSSQLAQTTASNMVTSALGIGQSMITAVTFMIALVVINPVLAVVVAGVECFAIAASLSNAKRQAQMVMQNTIRSRRQQSYSTLLSNAVAAKEVRLFGLGDFLRGRMLTELYSINGAERTLGRRLLWVESVLGVVSAGVIAGGLLWAVAQVAAGRMPLGDVSLFLMAAMGMQGAMSQIAMGLGGITQSVTTFGAYTDVVSAAPDLPVSGSPKPVPPLRQGITVENVWFRYDKSHPWVLRGLDLFIPAGSHVALVGRNGSGKSTLVKLLCRMYDPERGAILWDGVNIRELDPVRLRERISGVFQDFVCYELTAAENIGVGDLASLGNSEAIRQAAELAGAAADVDALPQGYDTMLSRVYFSGKRGNGSQVGVSLSGGQRQRVALARALMRTDRDLLIVDEPMANLDAEAEDAMNRRLGEIQAGQTCVLISHRMASVRECGRIIVIADGAVTEKGTHTELMAAGGRYARLFKLQAAGYSDDTVFNGADPSTRAAQ